MTPASQLLRIVECDVGFALLAFCDYGAVAALSRTTQCLHRRLASRDVWRWLCARDYPRVRWKMLQSKCSAHPQRAYRICAQRDRYDHCILCDRHMWHDPLQEKRLLLLCPCLEMPQYIVAHEWCCLRRPPPPPAAYPPAAAPARCSRSRTLPNSHTLAQRRIRTYTCHFCNRLRNAIPITLYSL